MTVYPNTNLPHPDTVVDVWEMLSADTRPIVIYGMGNGADKLIDRLALYGRECSDFFASDGFVRGQVFHGKTVRSFTQIKEKYDDFVILVSFGSHLQSVCDIVFAMAKEYTLLIPDLPLAGDLYFSAEHYRHNFDEFYKLYERLADDISRDILVNIIQYKLTAQPQYLQKAVFCQDENMLLHLDTVTTFVDVGAYRGDTVKATLSHAPMLKEIYALEPDAKNYAKLCLYAQTLPCRTHCIHAAAWDENGDAYFASSKNRNASLLPSGAAASFEHKIDTVKTVKLDDVVETDTVDYIKYDTEGAEMQALRGSSKLIQTCLPYLLISAYHRTEDLLLLPRVLDEIAPDAYRLYFRRRLCFPAWDLNLIAIPHKRED